VHQDTNVQIKIKSSSLTSEPRVSLTVLELDRDANVGALSSEKVEKCLGISSMFYPPSDEH